MGRTRWWRSRWTWSTSLPIDTSRIDLQIQKCMLKPAESRQESLTSGNAYISSVLSLSSVRLFATPWSTAHQASLSITNSRSLLKYMSIELVMPSSHLILCHPLLLLTPIPPSIKVFSNESTLCLRWLEFLLATFGCFYPSKIYILNF